jgi:hypothetical protein
VTPLRDGLKRRKTISSTSLIVLRMCKIHTKIDCICLQHTPHADAHRRTHPRQPANRRTLSPVRESRVCSPSPSSAQELPLCRSPPPPMSSPQRPLLQIDSAPTPSPSSPPFLQVLEPERRYFFLPMPHPPGERRPRAAAAATAALGERRPCMAAAPAWRKAASARGRPAGATRRRSRLTHRSRLRYRAPRSDRRRSRSRHARHRGPQPAHHPSRGRRQGAAARHDPTAGSAPVCALTAGSHV